MFVFIHFHNNITFKPHLTETLFLLLKLPSSYALLCAHYRLTAAIPPILISSHFDVIAVA